MVHVLQPGNSSGLPVAAIARQHIAACETNSNLMFSIKLPLVGSLKALRPKSLIYIERFVLTAAATKTKKKINSPLQNLRRSTPSDNGNLTHILSLFNKNGAEDAKLEKYLSPVACVTVGDAFDLGKVRLLLGNECQKRMVIPDEVCAFQVDSKTVMVLANGSVVGWGTPEDRLESDIIPKLRSAVIEPCVPESEEMDWIDLGYIPEKPPNYGNSYMQGEIMVLQGDNEDKKLLDMAAFAIGLSRSTRLSILENALENHIQLTRKNSISLSKGHSISTNEHDVLKLTGSLFLLRGKLNLYSELIETPDVYWTEPTLEKIYESISRAMDVPSRISILNRKLDYATDEQRALLAVLNEKKSTRLEWIIIILIMVEVVFESFHFYESRQSHNETA